MLDLEALKNEALDAVAKADSKTLEELRIEYLSKKGKIQSLMAQMRELPPEEKPKFGQMVNDLKNAVSSAMDEKKAQLEEALMNVKLLSEKVDITLDAYTPKQGTLHPLTLVQKEIEDVFIGMGYNVAEGPELESDLYNFTKANTPEGHPARDMQDTFYVDPTHLLRSQTTAIQMRVLEQQANDLPIKVICPGKVYRRDDDDATHSHQFTQCEGLVIGKNITVADLKGTLELMIREMFSKDAKIRFRPSYFPFTEPSFEVDMTCHICHGKGCPTCKGTGWIEILGSGMVHPNVLEMAGIDSKIYTGFAFGVGIERVAMLKYGITDIRDLYTNDVRFLDGFKR
ncbi:MAG: phenylalanine--tRNA ligase subunit alpha [Erysipelotrichaceae bacterium]|jgi:phenylalanyl-tRNA synthetase alpha chain|nr:phenylalanine--tRNA ligase subunit alpha [Erysipelotrichaceae bacterium]MBQ1911374.1 phenylalanine--tRNA ligase subunit alpha [Erysipelotrichaceae bacterium]MBQ2138207.1 phenylalanine--tRNA ligase subunit alpha [Erysipelotrichaceae bacterium]MBQ2506248.1 phenylalanine--tRNA ligase subunit alpha [Erysipelotrichaceae bacterium]MBQ3962943.1 phenylalanine--tRNA ligase subunit alpha [Erysipelotrichaceae bacterium]